MPPAHALRPPLQGQNRQLCSDLLRIACRYRDAPQIPHCKTCGRPRKGHPLRACDVQNIPATAPTPTRRTSPLKSITIPTTPPSGLIDALAAMNLDSNRDQQEKRERRLAARAQVQVPPMMQSLPSISTITGELLESLPGLMNNLDDSDCEFAEDSERRDAVLRWREKSDLPKAIPPLPLNPRWTSDLIRIQKPMIPHRPKNELVVLLGNEQSGIFSNLDIHCANEWMDNCYVSSRSLPRHITYFASVSTHWCYRNVLSTYLVISTSAVTLFGM
ncbi:hypothetical protein C8R46DRAFT_661349 [Mycena filopes]|nr:hypothetical protein C8R46DRAFT_661349 [Mycena filopes]